MLDRHIVPRLKAPLRQVAMRLHRVGAYADQVSLAGFATGLVCIALLAFELYMPALLALVVNRLADGVDGELARLREPTDAGGYLDITLDFIFYALFPLGFALADPAANALPAAVLIASFVGTGASFLAFSSMAGKHAVTHPDFSYKGLYYLDGLAEGTETIICFVLMCLLPDWFAVLAFAFAFICLLTAANRVIFGYLTLRRIESASSASGTTRL